MSDLVINPDGWLEGAEHIPSPNFDQRSDVNDICLTVVHSISLPPNQFGGDYIEQFFCNCLNPEEHEYFEQIKALKVSAHILIRRDGHMVQFVSFLDRAWHAGVSTWFNREACNDFSIGIELEGADHIPYDDAQYHQLNRLLKAIKTAYPKMLDERSIVGHNDIAPGRKTDPGEAFDWQRVDTE